MQEAARCLSGLAPGHAIGVVAPESAPPYNLPVIRIEKGRRHAWLSALARQTKDGEARLSSQTPHGQKSVRRLVFGTILVIGS